MTSLLMVLTIVPLMRILDVAHGMISSLPRIAYLHKQPQTLFHHFVSSSNLLDMRLAILDFTSSVISPEGMFASTM